MSGSINNNRVPKKRLIQVKFRCYTEWYLVVIITAMKLKSRLHKLYKTSESRNY